MIVFDYFSHTPTDGYASVESYTNVDYADIPSFVSPVSGTTKQLRDCLDFRPVKSISSAGTLQTNEDIPDADTSITANTIFYLPRKDKLTLTKDRVYKVINGVSAENTILPKTSSCAISVSPASSAITGNELSAVFWFLRLKRPVEFNLNLLPPYLGI